MIETVRRSISSGKSFDETDWDRLETDLDEWRSALSVIHADLLEERARVVLDGERELTEIQQGERSRKNAQRFNAARDRMNARRDLIEAQLTRLRAHNQIVKEVAPGQRIESMRGLVTLALEGVDMMTLEDAYIVHIDRFDEDDWVGICAEDD